MQGILSHRNISIKVGGGGGGLGGGGCHVAAGAPLEASAGPPALFTRRHATPAAHSTPQVVGETPMADLEVVSPSNRPPLPPDPHHPPPPSPQVFGETPMADLEIIFPSKRVHMQPFQLVNLLVTVVTALVTGALMLWKVTRRDGPARGGGLKGGRVGAGLRPRPAPAARPCSRLNAGTTPPNPTAPTPTPTPPPPGRQGYQRDADVDRPPLIPPPPPRPPPHPRQAGKDINATLMWTTTP
jgi:hypothetical protein